MTAVARCAMPFCVTAARYDTDYNQAGQAYRVTLRPG